jgi:PPM family protein phosphatase
MQAGLSNERCGCFLRVERDLQDRGPMWLARPDLGLLAVASPLGASALAATFALETLAVALPELTPPQPSPEPPACARLRGAILETERRWQQRVSEVPSVRGLGASLAAVLLDDDTTSVAHVGDYRVHQIRRGRIFRRTADHAAEYRGQRLLLRSIGLDSNPDVARWDLDAEDLLVVTGGVHAVLDDRDLVATLEEIPDSAHAVAALIQRALAPGATDVLTVLLFRNAQRDRWIALA